MTTARMKLGSARRRPTRAVVVAVAAVLALAGGTCSPGRGATDKNDLSTMRTVPIEIVGRTTYTAYVADENATRTLGLMNTTADELADDRGMIFVFDRDEYLSFWMRNTIIPLDIAFIRSDGTIVKMHTMQPLDESGYPSIEPARFALEVKAGQFAQHGVVAGDHVNIPPSLFGN